MPRITYTSEATGRERRTPVLSDIRNELRLFDLESAVVVKKALDLEPNYIVESKFRAAPVIRDMRSKMAPEVYGLSLVDADVETRDALLPMFEAPAKYSEKSKLYKQAIWLALQPGYNRDDTVASLVKQGWTLKKAKAPAKARTTRKATTPAPAVPVLGSPASMDELVAKITLAVVTALQTA